MLMEPKLEKLQSLASWFAPYNIRDFDKGGGGSDIGPLKALGCFTDWLYT